ncbi:MAG: RNA polymerase sigma factor [Candidatus Paceibacteria bacterium]
MLQSDLEKIFADTFATYSDAIFRFCLLKVSSVELAEDMTQEVFMRYWQSLRNGKEMTNTRSLLYTIANNLAKDWYKKKKPVSLEVVLESGHQPAGEVVVSPENSASFQEVLAVIDGMDENDKEVLILTYVEGLPPVEIAQMIEVTANTVSVRLSRAQERLKKQLHTHE